MVTTAESTETLRSLDESEDPAVMHRRFKTETEEDGDVLEISATRHGKTSPSSTKRAGCGTTSMIPPSLAGRRWSLIWCQTLSAGSSASGI